MPTVATGVLLEQSEIWNLINEAADKKIEKAIDKLSDDVQENVAKIVSDEQKKKKSLQNELEKKEEEKEEVIEDEDDEPKDEDIEDEIEDEDSEDKNDEDEKEDTSRKTSIKISPDGKVDIVSTTNESLLITEIPKNGLLETLAVNEGLKMIQEGKEYNGDLALANALTEITVLEAFGSMGLIDFNENKVKELVRLAGGVEIK